MQCSSLEEPTVSPLDAASQSLFRLGRAFGRLPLRDLLASPADQGVELSAILVVQMVEAGAGEGQVTTVGDVAVRLGIDPSTASRLVTQTTRAGYLRRTVTHHDRRAVALELTGAGQQLAQDAARYQRAVFDAATADWTEAERQEFARLFVRFAAAITEALPDERRALVPGAQSRETVAAARRFDPTPTNPEFATVQAWHDALNARNLDRFAALLHDDIEFAGPQGTGHGAARVRDWAERAGIVMTPQRWFQGAGELVVTQTARWRDSATGALGEPIAVATYFQVDNGLVRRVARYDTLPEALAAAGLDASAEVEPPIVQP